MKNNVALILFTFFTTIANAQNFTLYGDKTFGGDLNEDMVAISLIDANKILITGRSQTDVWWDKTDPLCGGAGTFDYDVWIIMMDTNFNILWQKSFGGAFVEANFSIFSLSNPCSALISMLSNSNISCEKSENNRGATTTADYWICKIDTGGNIVWDKTFGGGGNDNLVHTAQLADGNYVVAGSSNSVIGGDKTVANFGSNDIWVVKFDSSRNKLWDKVYGGTGGDGLPQIIAVADGGFVLSGSTASPVSGTITQPPLGTGNSTDFYLTKIDSGGTVLWDKRYGGSGYDSPYTLLNTNDGGFLLGGNTNSPVSGDITQPTRGGADAWLIKTDSLGNKQWEKRYGGNKDEYVTCIANAPGGGYWFSGHTDSDSSFEVSENGYGLDDYWIVKIDSVGNKLWDKRFGGNSADAFTSFIVMPDSSVFLAGQSYEGQSAVKTDTSKGLNDYWIVHFKYSDVGTGIEENNNTLEVKVWPNPAANEINIKSNITEKATLTLYDQMGKSVLIKENTLVNTHFNISQLAKGVYYLNIVNDKINEIIKVVKM